MSVVAENVKDHENYECYITPQGRLANVYSAAVGNDVDVDFKIGSQSWMKMQHELLQQDLELRKANPERDLTRQEVDDIHVKAFASVRMPPQAFTTHVLLSQVAEYDTAKADRLWAEVLTGRGFKEIASDSWDVSVGVVASNAMLLGDDQTLQEMVQDYKEQLKNAYHLLKDTVEVGAESLLSDREYHEDLSECNTPVSTLSP